MIEINNLVKRYGDKKAVNGISFTVNDDEVLGFLGPNGAGKTTLIRILNQITAPDSGTVLFNGNPISRKDIEKIGYLPEERGLYKKMKVGEEAMYLAQLKGLSKQEALERLKYWFIKFEIQNWWNKKVEELSKGMQQKLQFITTVVHRPDFLILDEPFSGLDPINTNLIRQELLELKKQGTTIIISTHNMASVEEICDEICLINKAHKILEGNLAEIKQRFKENVFSLTLNSERAIPAFPDKFSVMETSSSANQHYYVVKVQDGGSANQLLQFVMEYGNVLAFNEVLPSMNDIFIQQVNNSTIQQ